MNNALRRMPRVGMRNQMLMPLRWIVTALRVGLKMCSRESYRAHLAGINLQISGTLEKPHSQHLIAYATDGYSAVEFSQLLPPHYQGQQASEFFIHRSEAQRFLSTVAPVVKDAKRLGNLYEYDSSGPGPREPSEPTLAVSLTTNKNVIVFPTGMMRIVNLADTPPRPQAIAKLVRRPDNWKAGSRVGIDVNLLERAILAAREACPHAAGRRGSLVPLAVYPSCDETSASYFEGGHHISDWGFDIAEPIIRMTLMPTRIW